MYWRKTRQLVSSVTEDFFLPMHSWTERKSSLTAILMLIDKKFIYSYDRRVVKMFAFLMYVLILLYKRTLDEQGS